MFSRCLLSLWFGGPVTFSVEQQHQLLNIRNAYELMIDFRKSFESPGDEDFFTFATDADLKVEHIRIRKSIFRL
jgi:hypothetical protein